MSKLYEQYKLWRKSIDEASEAEADIDDYADKKPFMQFAGIKKLEDDEFEELEFQYEDELIELETED